MTPPNTASAHWLGLEGRVCVVSGGASGIGEAIAHGLAQAGARIAVLDLDADRGDAVARDLRALGAIALFARCDITSETSVRAAAAGFLGEDRRVILSVVPRGQQELALSGSKPVSVS